MTLADRMYMCENENCKKAMRIRQDTRQDTKRGFEACRKNNQSVENGRL
jgi:hypothetical protein